MSVNDLVLYVGLQSARRRAGVSQVRLAQELGVSQSTVTRWETGEMEPSISNALKAAALLGCDVQDIWFLAPPDFADDEEVNGNDEE